MAKFEHRKFVDETIFLDGNEYDGCTFTSCDMVYRGGPLPVLANNNFVQCTWTMGDAASNTIAFLIMLYHAGGETIVEGTFDAIRKAKPTDGKYDYPSA